MDPERGLSFSKIKDKVNHPSVSSMLILLLILDTSMLIVGIIKKDDCPVVENIPLFLIVQGVVGITSKLLPFVNRKLELILINCVMSFLCLFEFIWLIMGSIWVYHMNVPNYNDKEDHYYCDKTAYLFTYWLITIRWILITISIITGCCCACCFCCRRDS